MDRHVKDALSEAQEVLDDLTTFLGNVNANSVNGTQPEMDFLLAKLAAVADEIQRLRIKVTTLPGEDAFQAPIHQTIMSH